MSPEIIEVNMNYNLTSRASQIFGIFGHTVFCVLLNKRRLMRPSLGRLEVVFDGGQASKADPWTTWITPWTGQLWTGGLASIEDDFQSAQT